MQRGKKSSSASRRRANHDRKNPSTDLTKSSIRQVFTGHWCTRPLIRSCHSLGQLIRHPIELPSTDSSSDAIQQLDPACGLVLFSQSFGDQSLFDEVTALLVVSPEIGTDERDSLWVLFQIRRDSTKQELESVVISLVGGLFAADAQDRTMTISLPSPTSFGLVTTPRNLRTHSSQIGSLPNFPLPSSFHFLVSCK